MLPDRTVVYSLAVFEILASDDSVQHVSVGLSYDSGDPYAVRMSFCAEVGKTVDWLLARDLLLAGLARPAGVGDIRIWPLRDDPSRVQIELVSPCGRAVLSAGLVALTDFLQRTFDVVPQGSESSWSDVDVDVALSQLLNDADGR